MPRRGSKKDADDNRSIMEMMGGGGKGTETRSKAKLPAGVRRKTSPVKRSSPRSLAGKRSRTPKSGEKEGEKGSVSEKEDAEGDTEMAEASDALDSSEDENPRPKKKQKKPLRVSSRRSRAVEVDKDLLAELGLSDDDDDDGIEELLNSATLVVKKGPRIQNNMSRILSTREEEMSDGERQELIERLDEEEAEEDSDNDDEGDGRLKSMRALGGASFGLQSQRLMETLAQSGGDVEKLVRYNFINWDPEKRERLRDSVLPELYDVLNTSPSALAPAKKLKYVDTSRLAPECSFLTTSGWLQLFRKNVQESSREELCSFLFRIVANCDETHVRASAFHLLDAIVRDEDTIALSSVAEVAPSMMLVGDGWALPYHSFLRSIEAYGMDISSFIPPDPDDDTPLLEMGTAFSSTEPKGSETFPQKNVILAVRLMEASVNAKPDLYSAEELVDMVLLAFCFILDPWLQRGVLVLESFITSCLNAFTAKQWRTSAVRQICEKLSDPTILADETQLVGALKHIAISMPREGGVDRGRLVKGHASVLALCSVLEMDVPELDYAAFPPVTFVVDIVHKIREDADLFTDGVSSEAGKKKRDYTRLYAMLCLLDTAIDKRLYEAGKNRASVKLLSEAIRQLDNRIKDKGGVLHLARKRVKEKLLMLQCTVDLLLL